MSPIPPAFARRVSLSRTEAAETLGCSAAFLDKLIGDGQIRCRRAGSRVFVVAADVWAFMGIGTSPAGSMRARSLLERLRG